MKKSSCYRKPFLIVWIVVCLLFDSLYSNSQTFCIESADQIAGIADGYRYELWNQNAQGTACMTLGEGALFSGEWDGILNYLARRGLSYNQTLEHQEVGAFFATYDCDYNPTTASGNSYLSIYGWTVDPLIEFYVIEDWRNWIPSMAGGSVNRGTIEVNGSVYDIIENTRTNQPSIVGTATFQQYFSIRRDERNSGTINISDHFKAWEGLGMDLGKLHEVSFVVEGYQSNGDFAFTELDVYVGEEKIVLGTDQAKSAQPIDVYPNPSSGQVSIKLDSPAVAVNVSIYDFAGKVIFSSSYENTQLIEIIDLDKGTYITQINGSGLNFQSKVVVQ